MFDSLFGAEMPQLVKFVLAFVVVLALILAATWVIRRLGGSRLGAPAGRGRPPRLAVIDAASVDGKRRLVLIRRDNVEHLILIGGPTDVVVEPNIVRAVPVAAPREAARVHGPEAAPRIPETAPVPEPAARQSRQAEAGRAPPPGAPARASRQAEAGWTPQPGPPGRPSRQAEPAAKASPAETPTRPLPEPVAAALRVAAPEPARTPPSPAHMPASPRQAAEPDQPVEMRQSPPTADVNLADMAQRLEAALRRPQARGPEGRARSEPKVRPAGEPGARPPASADTERPPRPAPTPATPEAARGSTPEAAPAPTEEPAKPETATEPKPPKSVFDSLEEEMASLLGRPAGKT